MQIACSITFKNYVKRNWKVTEDGTNKIHPNDRLQVKALIVDLMLSAPVPVQKQLSQAIAIIGRGGRQGQKIILISADRSAEV